MTTFKYALGNYYVYVNNVIRSSIDDMVLNPERNGECDTFDYLHYNPIKTIFNYWPIIYSSYQQQSFWY